MGREEGALAQIFAQQRGPSAADAARKHLKSLISVSGRGNVYAELQRHFRRKEEVRNQAVVELARDFGPKLLATNGLSHAIYRSEQRFTPQMLHQLNHPAHPERTVLDGPDNHSSQYASCHHGTNIIH